MCMLAYWVFGARYIANSILQMVGPSVFRPQPWLCALVFLGWPYFNKHLCTKMIGYIFECTHTPDCNLGSARATQVITQLLVRMASAGLAPTGGAICRRENLICASVGRVELMSVSRRRNEGTDLGSSSGTQNGTLPKAWLQQKTIDAQ